MKKKHKIIMLPTEEKVKSERISLTKKEYLRDIKQILDDLNDHAESLPTDADINNYIKNWVDKKYNK